MKDSWMWKGESAIQESHSASARITETRASSSLS